MKTTFGLTALAAVVCMGFAAIFWHESSQPSGPSDTTAGPSRKATGTTPGADSATGSDGAREQVASRNGSRKAGVWREADPSSARKDEPRISEPPPGLHGRSRIAWPVKRRKGHSGNAAEADAAQPSVPVKLAFRALWYLGVDPEAEKTWRRAINDPTLSAGVRSDLIVDMIDEGYTDNNHPGRADLPVIRARLEIIERYAPYAMDKVNADAFAEAYRYLLEMYIRLGGAPRR